MSVADWQLYVEDNALIADFPEGMPTEGEVFEQVNAEFERLAARDGVDTHISVLGMESALSSEVFEKAKTAASVGTEFGISTWIVVSEDIKSMALKGQVEEIEGVEAETVDTLEEALQLARQ